MKLNFEPGKPVVTKECPAGKPLTAYAKPHIHCGATVSAFQLGGEGTYEVTVTRTALSKKVAREMAERIMDIAMEGLEVVNAEG